ncbi:MAG: hypothetical protein AB1689_05715, partial [Thermodesulfobacteriota bacterium]
MTAPTRLAASAADPRLFELLAREGFGEDVFNERQHASCEFVELYVVQLALRLLEELDLTRDLAEARSVDELVARHGFPDAFRAPLAWLLAFLAQSGALGVAGAAAARYRFTGPAPAADPDAVREAAMATDPSYAPTYAMLARAAAAYGEIARGEDTAEQALFQNVGLWIGYFSNANGYYALSNRVAA